MQHNLRQQALVEPKRLRNHTSTALSKPIIWCVDSPGWGGSEINLIRVWRLLDRTGDTLLARSNAVSPIIEEANLRGFTILRHDSRNSCRYVFQELPTTFRLLSRLPNAVFIIWSHHFDSNRWLQLALAIRRLHFVVVEQLIPTDKESFKNSRLTLPIKRYILPKARFIVLNALTQKQAYLSLTRCPEESLYIIPNTRPINEIAKKVAAERSLKRKSETDAHLNRRIVLLCVARLAQQKGQRDLLAALNSLTASTKERIALILVGDGEDKAVLEQLAKAMPEIHVTFKGNIDNIYPVLASADIFVLPSYFEGLPGALIEALAARIPCIASDIPGNRDLIRDRETGLLFRPGNIEELRKGIETLIAEESFRTRLETSGFCHALKYHDESIEKVQWSDAISRLQQV